MIIRSNDEQDVLFKVYRSVYPEHWGGYKEIFDHHHQDIEISCIVSGSGTYDCGGTEYSFKPGDVFLHCVNERHCLHNVEPDSQLTMVVFRFDQKLVWMQGSDWDKYMQLFMEKSPVGHHINSEAKEAKEICSLLQNSFNECKKQEKAYQLIVKAYLSMMLAYFFRYFYDDLTKAKLTVIPQHKRAIACSMAYISRNLDSNITLDSIAAEANMSLSYFSTVFKKLNGVTVWEYITNQRIEKAEYLLETTNIPIIEISENCGFNNISNFNRAFRKITGRTPRNYRKYPFLDDSTALKEKK